jgi:hypothetical protein
VASVVVRPAVVPVEAAVVLVLTTPVVPVDPVPVALLVPVAPEELLAVVPVEAVLHRTVRILSRELPVEATAVVVAL